MSCACLVVGKGGVKGGSSAIHENVSLLPGCRRQLLADDKADLREFKERFLLGRQHILYSMACLVLRLYSVLPDGGSCGERKVSLKRCVCA